MEKKKIWRAGVIPYHIDDNKRVRMLFMKPATHERGGLQFQIAKGKIEDGEMPMEAAFREANEELGLLKSNIMKKSDCGVYLSRTHIYAARIEDPELFGVPMESETGDTRWMTINEFRAEGRELHSPIVEDVYNMIRSEEDVE